MKTKKTKGFEVEFEYIGSKSTMEVLKEIIAKHSVDYENTELFSDEQDFELNQDTLDNL